MANFEVKNVSFKSNGFNCSGRIYLPANKGESLACVVFANGFSATMDWILPDFARRFAEAGFAAFIFDYRHLGESEGEPRQVINLKNQRTDLRNALTWVRDFSGIDKRRIALWGTSLGGSHVVEVASSDNEIVAIINNMPAIDAFKGGNVKAKAKAANASSWQIVITTFQLLGAALYDVIKKTLGLNPYYLEVYGQAGRAIFTDPSLVERFKMLAKGSASWQNKVAARVLFDLPKYKDGTIQRIKSPIFVALASKDAEIDNSYVRVKFSESANVEIKEYPYNHFSMYHEEAFEEVVKDQVSFLKKHLER